MYKYVLEVIKQNFPPPPPDIQGRFPSYLILSSKKFENLIKSLRYC